MNKFIILNSSFIILLLAGCGESDIRKQAKQNMVAGCIGELSVVESAMDSDRVIAFCECAVDRIAKNYTDAELVEMGKNPEKFDDRSTEDAVQAITKCQDKLLP